MIVTITISDIETGGIDVKVAPSEEVKPETRSLALATSLFMLQKLKEAEEAALKSESQQTIITPDDPQK